MIAIRTLRVGGAESLACHEAIHLMSLGYQVEVWYQIDGPFRAKLIDSGVKVVRVAPWSGRRRIRVLSSRQQGRLVIHTHSPSSGALLRVVSMGITNTAFVHTEHNVSFAYRPITRLLHRLTARRIGELVAVSPAALETAPPTRSSRVLRHLDLSLPRMQACMSLPFKESGALNVACVASLTAKKDHATLLASLILLDRTLAVPLEVSLVGEGPLRGEITSQVAVLNRGCRNVVVRMLGHREDIASVMSHADLLVLSSTSEGLPLVLFEAMASSTPIVATDVGGVREICDDGRAGLLVPSGDPGALAAALDSALSDAPLRARLAVRAKTHLLDQVGTPWLDTYRDAIDRLGAGT